MDAGGERGGTSASCLARPTPSHAGEAGADALVMLSQALGGRGGQAITAVAMAPAVPQALAPGAPARPPRTPAAACPAATDVARAVEHIICSGASMKKTERMKLCTEAATLHYCATHALAGDSTQTPDMALCACALAAAALDASMLKACLARSDALRGHTAAPQGCEGATHRLLRDAESLTSELVAAAGVNLADVTPLAVVTGGAMHTRLQELGKKCALYNLARQDGHIASMGLLRNSIASWAKPKHRFRKKVQLAANLYFDGAKAGGGPTPAAAAQQAGGQQSRRKRQAGPGVPAKPAHKQQAVVGSGGIQCYERATAGCDWQATGFKPCEANAWEMPCNAHAAREYGTPLHNVGCGPLAAGTHVEILAVGAGAKGHTDVIALSTDGKHVGTSIRVHPDVVARTPGPCMPAPAGAGCTDFSPYALVHVFKDVASQAALQDMDKCKLLCMARPKTTMD